MCRFVDIVDQYWRLVISGDLCCNNWESGNETELRVDLVSWVLPNDSNFEAAVRCWCNERIHLGHNYIAYNLYIDSICLTRDLKLITFIRIIIVNPLLEYPHLNNFKIIWIFNNIDFSFFISILWYIYIDLHSHVSFPHFSSDCKLVLLILFLRLSSLIVLINWLPI